jgi:hypothetical protein
MNDSELNDSAVLSAVRDSVSAVPMPAAPHLEAITARGRRRQRRRVAGLSVAGAGACAALVAVLAAGSGPAVPAGRPDSAGSAPPPRASAAQLTAFTVVADSDGSTTLTLYPAQVINPDAVRQALAEHGIPALVTAGKFCRTADQPAPGVGQVAVLPGQPLRPEGHPANRGERPGAIVIHGSAIPRGVKLSIGYRQDPQSREISFTLIKAGAPLTCTAIPDNGPHGDD